MELYIDATGYEKVTFALSERHLKRSEGSKNKLIKKSFKVDAHKTYQSLEKLDWFLKSAKVKLSHIKKIIINKGPGSFTGVRVSAAHALALKLALKIPVKFLPKEKFKM